MGRFGGVGDAKYNEGGVYFQPGRYLVRVDVVKTGESRKKVEFFVVECTILYSENPELKKGGSVSWMVMSDWDTYLGNIKHFVSVAQEVEMDEVDEEGVEMCVSDENPLAGTFLVAVAANVKTKKDADFTKVKWMQPEAEDFAAAGLDKTGKPLKKPAAAKEATA